MFLLGGVEVFAGLKVEEVRILCDFLTWFLEECEGKLRDRYPTVFMSSGEAYNLALAVGLNEETIPK